MRIEMAEAFERIEGSRPSAGRGHSCQIADQVNAGQSNGRVG